MRVSVIGQAAFGEAVLKRLVEDGVEIAGVSAPAPAEGARPDPLWNTASEMGLPLIPTGGLKDEATLGKWRALDAELCVMAFVTEILPEAVFDVAALGTIQYHPSLLPLHRGASAMNWPIMYGAKETGLSIFWPDQGIDTGPVLLQKRCEITPDDTMGSLYFEKLFPMGVEAMSEAVRLVIAGEAPKDEQDHTIATYEPPCREQHGEIRWYEPAERVYNLVRGCNPQPGAWTKYGDAKLKIFDCKLLEDREPGMPGRVICICDEGIDVRLNGGRLLRVGRVQAEGGKKVPAKEWAESVGLKPGFRFK